MTTTEHDLTIRALTDEDWGVIEASCPVCGVEKFHSAFAAHEWHSHRTGGVPVPYYLGPLLCPRSPPGT
jgi:hypothetical protein